MNVEDFAKNNNRLIHNMVLWGKVKKTNYTRDTGRVWVSLGAHYGEDELVDLPWLRRRGGKDWEWWAPEIDEQVLILAPGGKVERGVIIGSLPYQEMSESLPSDDKDRVANSPPIINTVPTFLANGRLKNVKSDKDEKGKESKVEESSSHVIHYEDGTEFSYSKNKRLLKAVFPTPDSTAEKDTLITEFNISIDSASLVIGMGPMTDQESVESGFRLIVSSAGSKIICPQLTINGKPF